MIARSLALSLSLASLASLAFLAPACVVHNDTGGSGGGGASASDGTLTVDWTINDSKSATECDSNAASSIQITVIDSSGANVGTYEKSCASFATSIELAPGSYTANALLVDDTGHPRTTAVAIDGFTIHGADDLNTPIDFPQSSFH